jgi:dihydrofolate synthase/folylpolyglutamate synthase
MLRALIPAISHLIVTRPSTERAADPAELGKLAVGIAPDLPVLIQPRLRDALDSAWSLSTRITIAGSIFLLGNALEELALA